MTKIRAGRPKPGLLRQHLTALNAAVAVSGATVAGANLGSKVIAFTPGTLKAAQSNGGWRERMSRHCPA